MTRQEFEKFLSSPRFEKRVTRWPADAERYAWPGQYKEYCVQLAWEVLVEAKRQKKLREDAT